MGRHEYSEDNGEDRDERALGMSVRKGAQTQTRAPTTASAGAPAARANAWGGALRRIQTGTPGPSREDTNEYVSVPGRYVPIGYAKFVAPVVNPNDYQYYRVGGWRTAVPRTLGGPAVRDLLYRIFYFGPQSAGYVRLGDTLVPAIMEDGDRMTLAETAVDFEPYPLSP